MSDTTTTKRKRRRKPRSPKGRVSRQAIFTVPQLRSRGWTDSMIRRFLGEPDDTAPNPYYRSSGAPMRLYAEDRVLRAEGSAEFRAALARSERRREAARKAAATKAAALLERVREAPISVRRVPADELFGKAIEHYNAFRAFHRSGAFREDFTPAHPWSDPDFLYRITRNYIRHELTNYDYTLFDRVRGNVGCEDAYWLFRERLDEEINRVYGSLDTDLDRWRTRNVPHSLQGMRR